MLKTLLDIYGFKLQLFVDGFQCALLCIIDVSSEQPNSSYRGYVFPSQCTWGVIIIAGGTGAS